MKKQLRIFRIILQVVIFILFIPMLPVIISGAWNWWQGWLYAFVYILGFGISRWLAHRHSPDILAERAKLATQKDAKPWDKILAPLVGIGGGLIPISAGVEKRLGEAVNFQLPVEMIGLLLLILGFILGSYALIENKFFSGVVRIQNDRGHYVIDSGPYRWIRHPGYAGALLSYIGIPLLLDSIWTYIPVAFMAIILIIRTSLEDLTLQKELPGYAEYTTRTRYRLFPGVW